MGLGNIERIREKQLLSWRRCIVGQCSTVEQESLTDMWWHGSSCDLTRDVPFLRHPCQPSLEYYSFRESVTVMCHVCRFVPSFGLNNLNLPPPLIWLTDPSYWLHSWDDQCFLHWPSDCNPVFQSSSQYRALTDWGFCLPFLFLHGAVKTAGGW